ncbi:hypothetical protein B0H11DRAFT_2195260 [Mycena galericulata]|nr:hypothetical protein B0H11DRAFT_2195260 [Mycena galericulata]
MSMASLVVSHNFPDVSENFSVHSMGNVVHSDPGPTYGVQRRASLSKFVDTLRVNFLASLQIIPGQGKISKSGLKKPFGGQGWWILGLKKPLFGQGNRKISASKSHFSGQSLAGASRGLTNGTSIPIGLATGEVELWDAVTGTRLRTMPRHQAQVSALSWWQYVVSSGCADGSMGHHDVRVPRHEVMEVLAHRGDVCGLEWRSDNSLRVGATTTLLISGTVEWVARGRRLPARELRQGRQSGGREITLRPSRLWHGVLGSATYSRRAEVLMTEPSTYGTARLVCWVTRMRRRLIVRMGVPKTNSNNRIWVWSAVRRNLGLRRGVERIPGVLVVREDREEEAANAVKRESRSSPIEAPIRHRRLRRKICSLRVDYRARAGRILAITQDSKKSIPRRREASQWSPLGTGIRAGDCYKRGYQCTSRDIGHMENSLKEWAMGVRIQIKLTEEEFRPRYQHHRAALLNLQMKLPTWFAQFQRSLYSKIVLLAHSPIIRRQISHTSSGSSPIQRNELDSVDFEALEAAATGSDKSEAPVPAASPALGASPALDASSAAAAETHA